MSCQVVGATPVTFPGVCQTLPRHPDRRIPGPSALDSSPVMGCHISATRGKDGRLWPLRTFRSCHPCRPHSASERPPSIKWRVGRLSGVSRVLGDIYRASIPCSDEGSRSWSSVKACHLPGLRAKGGFEKLPGGHRGSRYDGEQGPGLVRGTCKEGRSISRAGAVASGPALPTLSRTIAKSGSS